MLQWLSLSPGPLFHLTLKVGSERKSLVTRLVIQCTCSFPEIGCERFYFVISDHNIITREYYCIHLQGVSQIHVLNDPNYIPLCQLLGEEDAERLILFVNAPLPTRKLTLQPDSSREHRQEVGKMKFAWEGEFVFNFYTTYKHVQVHDQGVSQRVKRRAAWHPPSDLSFV